MVAWTLPREIQQQLFHREYRRKRKKRKENAKKYTLQKTWTKLNTKFKTVLPIKYFKEKNVLLLLKHLPTQYLAETY